MGESSDSSGWSPTSCFPSVLGLYDAGKVTGLPLLWNFSKARKPATRTLGLCLASEVMLWGVTNPSLTTDTLGDSGTDYVAVYPSKHFLR